MPSKKILCATDGSRPSTKAVDFAIEFARDRGLPLTFLTVNTVSSESASRTHFWDHEIIEAVNIQVGWDLHDAKVRAAAAGLTGAQYATCAARNIAKGIVQYAEAHGFDHIIVGHAGHGALGRIVLGSVARDVVNYAHCPVTVVC